MSRDNVNAFIRHLEGLGPSGNPIAKDPEAAAVIAEGAALGFAFTEDDLKSALNTRICNAESLPRPWGWALARRFGLVRG